MDARARTHADICVPTSTLCCYVSLCVWGRDTQSGRKVFKVFTWVATLHVCHHFHLLLALQLYACVRAQSHPLISALSCMAPCDTSDSHKHRAVTPYIFTPYTPQSFPLSFCLFLPPSFSLLCIYWCVKLFWDGGMDSSLMGWVEAWAFCSIIDWGCMCICLLK